MFRKLLFDSLLLLAAVGELLKLLGLRTHHALLFALFVVVPDLNFVALSAAREMEWV